MWLDNELANSSEIQELYDLSTQVEPREREDEKMYLPCPHESLFSHRVSVSPQGFTCVGDTCPPCPSVSYPLRQCMLVCLKTDFSARLLQESGFL